jgi:hypothetical protein
MVMIHRVEYADGSSDETHYSLEQAAAKWGDELWAKWFNSDLTAFQKHNYKFSSYGQYEIDTHEGVKMGEEFFWVEADKEVEVY